MEHKHTILKNDEKYFKQEYKDHEDKFTLLFDKNYQKIISEKSFWIPIEKQIKSKKKNFKDSLIDGFLLTWENPTTPTFYLVEIELESHGVDRHILPQIGNFISFIRYPNKEELNNTRKYIYTKIKENKNLFKKIQKDTDNEVHQILENSMDELQILLVIDKISPDLDVGLSKIEKAINVKIRKIEVSSFLNQKNDEIILFSDSEITPEEESDEITGESSKYIEEYTLDYHLDDKPDKIKTIFNSFLEHTKNKGSAIKPMKHYIGFYKNEKMIFSSVVRKKSIVFYSKAKINEIKLKDSRNFRDVTKIGHYTNHLPTEIVITEEKQLNDLFKYFEEVYAKY